MRTLALLSGDHTLDRATVDNKPGWRFLGIIADVFGDEPRAFLVCTQLARGEVFGECADRFQRRLGIASVDVASVPVVVSVGARIVSLGRIGLLGFEIVKAVIDATEFRERTRDVLALGVEFGFEGVDAVGLCFDSRLEVGNNLCELFDSGGVRSVGCGGRV